MVESDDLRQQIARIITYGYAAPPNYSPTRSALAAVDVLMLLGLVATPTPADVFLWYEADPGGIGVEGSERPIRMGVEATLLDAFSRCWQNGIRYSDEPDELGRAKWMELEDDADDALLVRVMSAPPEDHEDWGPVLYDSYRIEKVAVPASREEETAADE